MLSQKARPGSPALLVSDPVCRSCLSLCLEGQQAQINSRGGTVAGKIVHTKGLDAVFRVSCAAGKRVQSKRLVNCVAGKYQVFGELLAQPSRLAPNAAVDGTIGRLVAAGLQTSATVLCTNLLRSASKCAPAQPV